MIRKNGKNIKVVRIVLTNVMLLLQIQAAEAERQEEQIALARLALTEEERYDNFVKADLAWSEEVIKNLTASCHPGQKVDQNNNYHFYGIEGSTVPQDALDTIHGREAFIMRYWFG